MMNRVKYAIPLLAMSTSCASEDTLIFRSAPYNSERMELTGFVSLGQETLGLYPRPNWKLKRGEMCFYVDRDDANRLGLDHGDKVKLAADIQKTRCTEPNIACFQRCQDYILKNISVIENYGSN